MGYKKKSIKWRLEKIEGYMEILINSLDDPAFHENEKISKLINGHKGAMEHIYGELQESILRA